MNSEAFRSQKKNAFCRKQQREKSSDFFWRHRMEWERDSEIIFSIRMWILIGVLSFHQSQIERIRVRSRVGSRNSPILHRASVSRENTPERSAGGYCGEVGSGAAKNQHLFWFFWKYFYIFFQNGILKRVPLIVIVNKSISLLHSVIVLTRRKWSWNSKQIRESAWKGWKSKPEKT